MIAQSCGHLIAASPCLSPWRRASQRPLAAGALPELRGVAWAMTDTRAILRPFDVRETLPIDAAARRMGRSGRMFAGRSLFEMGRECLEAQGTSTRGMSRQEAAGAMLTRAGGMMSTSDFPSILANVANKTLRMGYQAAPQTFRPIVRQVTLPDLKQVSRSQLGETSMLEKVNESGEFHRGSMGEAVEKYAIATYGKVVAITRQVLVNDDLNAFTRIPFSFGIQAANLESNIVWAQILANAAMKDGIALFYATHANLGTAAAITTASVGLPCRRFPSSDKVVEPHRCLVSRDAERDIGSSEAAGVACLVDIGGGKLSRGLTQWGCMDIVTLGPPSGGYGVGDAPALAVPSARIKKLADATLSRQNKWHE
jgi:hypothetical protein